MINNLTPEFIVAEYIDKLIIPSSPERPLWNRESILYGKPARWNYIDGCMIKAILMLSDVTGDSRLIGCAERFTDYYVTENGDIPTLNPHDFNLDNVNGGKNLLTLYKLTGREKYLRAAEMIVTKQLASQPRLNCGNFTHKAIYPDQIWLDGAYMALPFMTEYAALKGDADMAEDVFRQLECIRDLMRDTESGLYYHGYNETRKELWSDPETGLSQEFWLRSMGWLSAALADIAQLSCGNEALRTLSGNMLADLLDALSRCITDDGLLLQLPARKDLEKNFPETSGTLLAAYSALKASRLGICGEKTKSDGRRLFSSVCEKYIRYENGIPILGNICLMAGLGGERRRDGSAEYYLGERIVRNDAKGIAPLIMAYAELIT